MQKSHTAPATFVSKSFPRIIWNSDSDSGDFFALILCIHFFISDSTRRKKIMQNVRPSSRVLLMKTTISTADLATKTCKRGHTGQYVLRSNGTSACRTCSNDSTLRHRGVEEARAAKLRRRSKERLAELDVTVAKLRVQLQLAETEHDFLTKTLAILDKTK